MWPLFLLLFLKLAAKQVSERIFNLFILKRHRYLNFARKKNHLVCRKFLFGHDDHCDGLLVSHHLLCTQKIGLPSFLIYLSGQLTFALLTSDVNSSPIHKKQAYFFRINKIRNNRSVPIVYTSLARQSFVNNLAIGQW